MAANGKDELVLGVTVRQLEIFAVLQQRGRLHKVLMI